MPGHGNTAFAECTERWAYFTIGLALRETRTAKLGGLSGAMLDVTEKLYLPGRL